MTAMSANLLLELLVEKIEIVRNVFSTEEVVKVGYAYCFALSEEGEEGRVLDCKIKAKSC